MTWQSAFRGDGGVGNQLSRYPIFLAKVGFRIFENPLYRRPGDGRRHTTRVAMLRKYISLFVLTVVIVAALSRTAIAGDAPGSTAAHAQPSPANAAPAKSPASAKVSAHPSKPAPAEKPKGSSQTQAQLPRMVIVVTATRMATPLSEIGTAASVVSGKLMQSQQIRDVTPALREVPSVQVTQSGSPGTISEVSIRGSTSAETLIMIDGVPINDSATGSFDVSRLTTDNLDRIEVVRGSGGALYGSQAIGGVINMISREGSGAPKFTLLSLGGNRASQDQVATFDGALGKLAYSGALSYFSTSGYRIRNDSSDNLSGSIRLDYHLDEDTVIRGFARYTRANVSLANFSNFDGIVNNPTAHQRNEFMLYKGEIDRKFGDRLVANASGYFVRDVLRLNELPFAEQARVPFLGLTSEVDNIPDETRGANLEAIYTWASGFRSLVGFDFKDRWVHSSGVDTFFAPPAAPTQFIDVFNARRQEYAGYVEQEARLFDGHLIGTGGFRVDGNSQFGEEVSPAWSVAIPLQHGFTLRGSYSEGFRAPSFNELYFPGFGNPNLSPEISSEWDGGFTKTFGESAEFTANYFSRRVHNLIVAVPCATNRTTCPDGVLAGNAGRVDTQGIEVIPSVHPMRGLTLSGSFTYLDETHVSGTSGARPTLVPKYSAASLIEFTRAEILRGGDRFTTTLAYTFVGDRDDITTAGSIASHDAYDLFDLSATYAAGIRWGVVRNESILTRVQNVFDRNYSQTFGFRAPPVNFLAGLKLDF
jgi:vitamin B12 transporter